MPPFVAAAVQVGPGGITPEALAQLLDGAGRVDLAVLPELAATSYFPLGPGATEAADPMRLDDPRLAAFGAVARDRRCRLVVGIHHETAAGDRQNAAVVLGPDGSVATGETPTGDRAEWYAKTHLCNLRTSTARFYESDYFRPGPSFVRWRLPFATLGTLICYDRHFAGAWAALRAAGVDVVAVPLASPSLSKAWFGAEIQAMAMQNGVFAVVANRAGVERVPGTDVTTEYLGGSCIVAPDGSVLASAGQQPGAAIATAAIDLADLATTRRELSYFEDRRPDLYVAG
jgi:N-carbamoylputrescine amidase